jgi:hypothetical protein
MLVIYYWICQIYMLSQRECIFHILMTS